MMTLSAGLEMLQHVQSQLLTKDDLAAAPSIQRHPTALTLPATMGRPVPPRLSLTSGLVLPDSIRFHSVSSKRLTVPGRLRREGKFCLAFDEQDVKGIDGDLNL